MEKLAKKSQKHQSKRVINRWFVVGVCAFLLIVIGFVKIPRFISDNNLKSLGYTETAITYINKYKLASNFIDNDIYSDYLATAITQDDFRKDDIEMYLANTSLDDFDWFMYDKLQNFDYSKEEAVQLVSSLEDFELTPLVVFDHLTDINAYIQDCEANRDTNSVDSFILDDSYIEYYANTTAVTDPSAINKLVNKSNYLSEDYVPDLVDMDLDYAAAGLQMDKTAYEYFKEMCEAAKDDGYIIYAGSAYRSYAYQDELFNNYIKSEGESMALQLAAKAGFSEHQTGLAVDMVAGTSGLSKFGDTPEYAWMLEHSYEYGFILRYPENKTSLTGYDFEPWHYRFVGVELAKKVHDSNLTYDEYYNLYLK